MRNALALLAVAFLMTGCLIGDDTHTLYLEPDGAVTWMVLQKDVRSNAKDSQNRQEEEDQFLNDAQTGTHFWARQFAEYQASEIESRLWRQERPYTLLTRARFESLETLLRDLLEDEEGEAVQVTTVGDRTELLMIFDSDLAQLEPPEDAEIPGKSPAEEASCEEDFRLVLAEGKFTEAIGFDIREDDSVAILCEPTREERKLYGGAEVFFLAWTTKN